MKNFLKDLFFGPFYLIKNLIHSIRWTVWDLGAPFVTKAGWEVINDPEKMEKVRKAIEEHSASRKHGPIIVEFEN